ncbi:hypothetical protein DH2020_018927 [Rehmannia glutinosa]|uniref:Uncharacterized protein n=1 Tax=Rehmannia glutinosa TaxID=99300 RepID=A0ABR0WPF3_REHGL
MAISTGLGFSRLPLPLRSPLSATTFPVADSVSSGDVYGKALEWKKIKSKDLGISTSKISRPTRVVLNGLRRRGFEVYLVMRTFSRCEMIGRRFPICHVHIGDTIVEHQQTRFGRDLSLDPEKPAGCDEEDYVRWRNCLQRDFTINGLMFDPYAKLVYDYTGGVNDIRKAKVRTIKPANLSFTEDCARILRAIRIAARLGFRFSKDTAVAVKRLSASVLRLDRGRLLMEVNYMMAYGSAEASLRLLWKLGLLKYFYLFRFCHLNCGNQAESLFILQAAYFVRHGFRRRDKRSNMLLSLFSNLDKFLAPDRPCHNSLWFSILAFHEALSEQPRDPLVIAVFSLAVHNGGDFFHSSALTHMTDEHFVSQAMAKYPKAPYSDLVFFPMQLYLRVCRIFDCVRGGMEKGFVPKHGSKIDYELLAMGSLREVRHVFARVVFDTIYPIDNRLQK